MIDGPDHGIVFEVGGNDVVAFREQSEDDQIESVGGVVPETQSFRAVQIATEEFRQPFAKFVEQLASLDCEIEAAASRIHAGLAIELQHEFINVFWLGPDRRGIVEIDEMVVHALRPEEMLGLGAARSTSRVKGI